MSRFFKGLKKGLDQALAYRKGKITLKSEIVEIPEPPVEYIAKDVKRIRSLGPYSQGYFAKFLNVSVV